MNISVIAIGDELMLGNVVDTNTPFIAELADRQGWKIVHTCHVRDDADDMIFAIKDALRRSDVVLTTGGLGPTKDDITKKVLCEYFNCGLVLNRDVEANVERIFHDRGLEMNELTRSQAMVPEACRVLPNAAGTAPVMWFERDGKVLASMPGVPREMRYTFTSEVIPALRQWAGVSEGLIQHRTLLLEGISESAVQSLVDNLNEAEPLQQVHIAYLPQTGYLKLRLDHTDAGLLDRAIAQVNEITGGLVIANDDITPAEALIELLRKRGLNVSTAESCTGGNIAHLITSVPGSSAVYEGSIVSYSNVVKMRQLNVPAVDLENHGAVSREVALAMSAGVAEAISTGCAIATTGIAGPGGAVEGKPVGTVWISVKTPAAHHAELFHFNGNRADIIERASVKGIVMLLRHLQ